MSMSSTISMWQFLARICRHSCSTGQVFLKPIGWVIKHFYGFRITQFADVFFCSAGGPSYYSNLEEGKLRSFTEALSSCSHSLSHNIAGSYWLDTFIEYARILLIFFLTDRFNAMVPNGILANNSGIIQRTQEFLDYVLTHQDATGWMGPEVNTTKPRYLWGRYCVS